MTDETPKRGAVPLDAAAKKVEAANSNGAEAPDAAKPVNPDADIDTMMLQTLSWLYNEVKAGRVKALSCVFVDDSDVPQHAFAAKPAAGVPLLAGVVCSTDAIKSGALQSMVNYREFLKNKALHETQQRDQASAAPTEGEASKPN